MLDPATIAGLLATGHRWKFCEYDCIDEMNQETSGHCPEESAAKVSPSFFFSVDF
jgi:hypothetical protein